MLLHTHFERVNLDALAPETRLCEVLSGTGYVSTVSKHAMPGNVSVARKLAQNSADPTCFAWKTSGRSNSSKGRDAALGYLTYGKQYTCFGVRFVINFQCGRAQRD